MDLTVINAFPKTVPIMDEFYWTMLKSFNISPEKVLNRYIVFVTDGVAVGLCHVKKDAPELLILHIDLPLVDSLLGPGFEVERGGFLERKHYDIDRVMSLFMETAIYLGSHLSQAVKIRVLRIY